MSSEQPPLGHREERFWPADPAAYGPRSARRGGRYEVFIPAAIGSRGFVFDDGAVAAVARATSALAHLDQTRSAVIAPGVLARNLLRSESMASSRIEGLQISHKRLARASFGRDRDTRALEVLGNVEAMERAIAVGADTEAIGVSHIEDVHRALLRHTEDHAIAGVLREEQNWIGGNDHNPVGATYVPPPPEHVRPLLEDLCGFVDRTDMAPVAQAAIAHAQFENIHPFADGNGRTGRALIYALLRRHGSIVNAVPPISLVLAREPKGYIGGIGAYSLGKVGLWCERFSEAITQAARGAEQLGAVIDLRQQAWIARLGNPRSDAAVRQIIDALPAQPVIDVPAAQLITGKSHVAVGKAIAQLEAAAVLVRLNERRWGRVWECDELFDVVEGFERALAS